MTYRSAAKFYDLFGSKNDLKFYKDLALESGKKALELGVGTARVALPLAKAGIRVVGIDNSVQMLKIAREKLAEEPKAVRNRLILKKGDMRDFELKQTFPFVYIPASTFDHNVTIEQRKRTLTCIHKHLEKNGTFAFDLEQMEPDKPEKSWWIDRSGTDDGKMIVRSIFTRRKTSKPALSIDLFFDFYKDGRLLDRYHEYGEVAIISRDEIVELLERIGFRVVSTYGDFDKARYKKNSPKMVFVTRRR